MTTLRNVDGPPVRFRWLDLAAADARRAAAFYQGMFGWQTRVRAANGGTFHEFLDGGEAIASLYQLSGRHLARGVPSHWTPYVGVADIDAMGSKATALGGQVLVEPFSVGGIARVSLIADSVGALVGLQETRR